ncbi:hypothetical protein G6321_00054920 (plasmid) [Bradyrhizobium barranii subsp. barranii]|uniref:Uncharacterized protein n=1 Tax=Bradyrhizobium barranii subsp. barranii TaxID=2823807 RepID=A0A7Z0QL94_9BRAD|nr:hypothetical protein [Bradyrhizobium barranii]UGX99553.1 hypothetical protein G6321_00054920 [Bradyrhizobium barranii subsp. barranii]
MIYVISSITNRFEFPLEVIQREAVWSAHESRRKDGPVIFNQTRYVIEIASLDKLETVHKSPNEISLKSVPVDGVDDLAE